MKRVRGMLKNAKYYGDVKFEITVPVMHKHLHWKCCKG
jgi:hypothetical protein